MRTRTKARTGGDDRPTAYLRTRVYRGFPSISRADLQLKRYRAIPFNFRRRIYGRVAVTRRWTTVVQFVGCPERVDISIPAVKVKFIQDIQGGAERPWRIQLNFHVKFQLFDFSFSSRYRYRSNVHAYVVTLRNADRRCIGRRVIAYGSGATRRSGESISLIDRAGTPDSASRRN